MIGARSFYLNTCILDALLISEPVYFMIVINIAKAMIVVKLSLFSIEPSEVSWFSMRAVYNLQQLL